MQFIQIISHYKKNWYEINVLRQTACLVVKPILIGNFAFLFILMPAGSTSYSITVPTYLQMNGLGPDVVSVVWPTGV